MSTSTKKSYTRSIYAYIKDSNYLRKLFEEKFCKKSINISIYCDNIWTIDYYNHPTYQNATKHYAIDINYSIQNVELGTVTLC